jgi:hypothetical protein
MRKPFKWGLNSLRSECIPIFGINVREPLLIERLLSVGLERGSRTFPPRYDASSHRQGRITNLTEGLTSVIAQLERQKTAIERARAALRDVEGIEAPAPAPAISELATFKRKGKNLRSLAQKKRWALRRAAETSIPSVSTKTAPNKGGMTEDGHRRLAEAMKRRWAVKRAASAVKGTARKQRAAKKVA